jgi:hypothetical protein
MQSTLVTIVVVPREKYSIAPHSLESIYQHITQVLAAAVERLLVPLACRKGSASAAFVRAAPDMAHNTAQFTDRSAH